MHAVDLPLFPLNVVLVPTMSLPLHIFEPRYREMVAHCLSGDARFGVLLDRPKGTAQAGQMAYEVGTVAEIMDTSRLRDDRMNIVAEGRERFRVLERLRDRPYLHAIVELLPEPLGEEALASQLAARCRRGVARYIQLLMQQANQEPIEMDLPSEPVDLSYKLADLLQQLQPGPPEALQQVLEAQTAVDRLRLEVDILRNEYAILLHMASSKPPQHSKYPHPN